MEPEGNPSLIPKLVKFAIGASVFIMVAGLPVAFNKMTAGGCSSRTLKTFAGLAVSSKTLTGGGKAPPLLLDTEIGRSGFLQVETMNATSKRVRPILMNRQMCLFSIVTRRPDFF